MRIPLLTIASGAAAALTSLGIPSAAQAHDLSEHGSAEEHDAAVSLPVGDGRVTTQGPQFGYVYSCTSEFRTGGARHYGDWLVGNRWYPEQKIAVSGAKSWPEAYFSMVANGDTVNVRMNNLPTNHPTGTFPVSQDDPAYEYDTNPNPIAAQHLEFSIPARPVMANTPGCLRRGMIGFTANGVALYNALDDAGLDAAAHEVQDSCGGHPSGRGQYHYHAGSPCIPGVKENAVIGWAIDGYPIMGFASESGGAFTNDMLDECHGHAQGVSIDGRDYSYAYRLTAEYPYTVGCYKGVVLRETNQQIREGLNDRRVRGGGRRQDNRQRPTRN